MSYNKYIHKNILIPLKMIHTGIDKTNITQYYFNIKKFKKYEKDMLMAAGSAGGLKSSISDLIKFKNFHKLLNNNSIKLLQEMYFCKYIKEDKIYTIYHNGSIIGNLTQLRIRYDNNWKFKDINIRFSTNVHR